MFYELLVSAGGRLFDHDLQPAFDSDAGLWAIEQIADMHLRRRITPRDLGDWHYDEISAAFRAGDAAMVTDWPGSYHLYRDPSTAASPIASASRCCRRDRQASGRRTPAVTRSPSRAARGIRRPRRRCSVTSRRSTRSSAKRGAAPSPAAPARLPPSGRRSPATQRPPSDGACLPKPSRR